MNTRRQVVLAAILIGAMTIFVSANSGPTSWEVLPSSESLTIDENSQIQVLHEILTFDGRDSHNNDYTMTSRVTAAYTMNNTSGKAHTSQMAFPFVASYYELSDTIEVMADDSIVPYTIYSGDPVDAGGNPMVYVSSPEFSFESITDAIMPEYFQSDVLTPETQGTLCTFVVQGGPVDHEVGITYDDGAKTNILSKGFNGYSVNGTRKEASGWQRAGEQASIFVMGEMPELTVKVYEDHAGNNEASDYKVTTIYEEMTYKAYFDGYIKAYIRELNEHRESQSVEMLDDVQIYNLITRRADTNMKFREGYIPIESVCDALDYKRLFTLVYEIPFEGNETKEVEVSYDARASMDSRERDYEEYTFQYLLNPASHWQSFGSLDIRIYTSDEYPELLSCNFELTEQEPGIYQGTYTSLPETDLIFSIKGKEVQRRSGFSHPLVDNPEGNQGMVYGVIIFIIILSVVVFAIRRTR